jgi:hypothetical protein
MRRAALAALLAALALAGCSGVPSSSSPETVEPLDTGGATTSTPPPANLDGDARQIVESFLAENATNTATHISARAYLTGAANNRWSDASATIIANEPTTGTFDAKNQTVTVVGRVLGTLSASGIYTPSLQGDGQGGDRQPFVFHLVRTVDKRWRIDKLPAGLVLTDDQFRETYRQQVLYFFDLAEDLLVPDLRWSALDDKTQRAKWLLEQLVDGPRQDLASAVSADTLPANLDPQHISVRLGSPTLIEIPGSSQLDPGVRDRLAAQVSETLVEALAGREMSITDGRVPVQIPRVASDRFTAADFTASIGPPTPESAVYYLVGGRVLDDSGRPLAGPLGDGSLYLSSIAIGQPQPDGQLYAAGITGSGDDERLEVGTVHGGLRPTSLQGDLSRPAFVPGRTEVWISAGSKLYRVSADAAKPRVSEVPTLSGGGQIVALRLSPEGSRIAIVIAGASGATQLYVGAVVRGAGPPRIDGLNPISPVGVVVQDVAWLDAFKLFAIGYLAVSQDSRTFETGADGTDWTNSTVNLPQPPDTVTAATSSNVWVSAKGYVWKLSGTSWVSPGTSGQTLGTAPIYLE